MARHFFKRTANPAANPAAWLAAVLALLALAVMTAPLSAASYETAATQAMLLDVDTGTVLYAKDPDTPIPPASLGKLMAIEVVFHAIKTGRLSLDDRFLVSEHAWRTGGAVSDTSTMFAELNSEVRLEDLIRGVIVQSANDGAIVIAEGIAGSEAGYADMMNERAAQIGLTNSVFRNPTGLPHPGQQVTIRDLVTLTLHIQRNYPDLYKIYAEREFTWNGIRQRNRNPLLPMDIGANGVKTGFTEESGYAIVGSVDREGRRLIVAMSGLTSERQRGEEARKMLDWGMRAFEPHRLFEAGDAIGAVRLYGGASASARVQVNEDVVLLMPLVAGANLRARIVFDGPVPAPVEIGDEIAQLEVLFGDEFAARVPLYASESVGKGPLHRRALDAVTEMLLGWIPT